MSKLLNIAELCAFLNISRATLHRWRKEGRMPEPVKKWGTPRWEMEEVKAALAQEKRVSNG